jgi:hypothetical protein
MGNLHLDCLTMPLHSNLHSLQANTSTIQFTITLYIAIFSAENMLSLTRYLFLSLVKQWTVF